MSTHLFANKYLFARRLHAFTNMLLTNLFANQMFARIYLN